MDHELRASAMGVSPAVSAALSLTLSLTLSLALLLVAGCAGTSGGHAGHAETGGGQATQIEATHTAGTQTDAIASDSAARAADATLGYLPPGFNGTDVAWLQLMIPMDEQTMELLQLAVRQGGTPAVRALARRIDDGHRAELDELRHVLRRSGLPETNIHKGHRMPGMVTAEDLSAVSATTGAAFDRLFADHLREHLDQSAQLSRSEQRSGADEGTRALAAAIQRARAAERARLDLALPDQG